MGVCECLDQKGVPSAGFPTAGRLCLRWDFDAGMRGLWCGWFAAHSAAGAIQQTRDSCASTTERDRRGRTTLSGDAEGGRAPVLAWQTHSGTAAALFEESREDHAAGSHRDRDLGE